MKESRAKIDRRLREERIQRWRYEAPLDWIRDHPGETEDDFDTARGPNATPEQAAEWKRWFNEVWLKSSPSDDNQLLNTDIDPESPP
jgi:hypothetical protein